MKIGIYAPYLQAYGGGEKYICKIAELLSEENEVEFIVFKPPDINHLQNGLNVNISKSKINHVDIRNPLSRIPYLKQFFRISRIKRITENYDLFINQEHSSSIPSLAKRSILICEVPPTRLNTCCYNNLIMKLLFDSKLRTYDKIIANSFYTKKWAEKYYQRKIEVLYPPIDTEQFFPLTKKNIILSVGRFFVGGHCKKQLEMIKIFKQLYEENDLLKGWEYHLIGGADDNIESQNYLKNCKEMAQNYPIYLHINLPFKVLKELYGKAKIFWHATGLGEDDKKHPERMEHFGITTVEGMSAGCVPIVINKGGQPEIVRNKIDGFTWNNIKELKSYTLELVNNEALLKKMSRKSIKRSEEFSLKEFNKRVKQILDKNE